MVMPSQRDADAASARSYRIRPAALFHPLTPLYDLGCSLFGYGRRFKGWIADQGQVEPHHRVLDVGCGTAVLARVLLATHQDLRLDLVDPDPRALRIARQRLGTAAPGVRLIAARGEALPLRSGCYQRIFSTLAVHHVPDGHREALFREVGRLLAPGGQFLYADFENHRRAWVPHHFRSARTLPDWLEAAGLDAERIGRRRGVHLFRVRVGDRSLSDPVRPAGGGEAGAG